MAGAGVVTTGDPGVTMAVNVEVNRGEEGIREAEVVEEGAMAAVRSDPVGEGTEEHTEVDELAEAYRDSGEVEVGVIQAVDGAEEE